MLLREERPWWGKGVYIIETFAISNANAKFFLFCGMIFLLCLCGVVA